MTWTIEENNDTGPNDDYFYSWYEVTDGEAVYRTNDYSDAEWLCNLLNKYDNVR